MYFDRMNVFEKLFVGFDLATDGIKIFLENLHFAH